MAVTHCKVPYLVGTKVLRDHQYMPTLTKDEYIILFGGTPGNPADEASYNFNHPIGVSLEMMQRLAWRVREWTIAAGSWSSRFIIIDGPIQEPGNFAFVDATGTTAEFSFGQRMTAANDDPDVFGKSERSIIGPWELQSLRGDFFPRLPAPSQFIWKTLRNRGVDAKVDSTYPADLGHPRMNHLTSYFIEPDPPHPPFDPVTETNGGGFAHTLGMEIRFRMLSDYVVFDPVTKLFYPNMIFGVFVETVPDGSIIPDGIIFNAEFQSEFEADGSPGGSHGSGTFTIDAGEGNTVDVPIAVANGGRFTAGAYGVTMTATKFWEFRNSLGQPVYDELTGVQIADPFA
jgi:hypothetical protein